MAMIPLVPRHLNKRLPVLLLLIAVVAAVQASLPPKLFPAAKQERYDPQTNLVRTLKLDGDGDLFKLVAIRADDDDAAVLEAAKQRFNDYLTKNLPDFPEEFPVNPKNQQLVPIHNIQLKVFRNNNKKKNKNKPVSTSNSTRKSLPPNFDESYQIQIDSSVDNDTILVEAKSVFGIVRGLESLAQLTRFGWKEKTTSSKTTTTTISPVYVIENTPLLIMDEPTFPYRGLMIDTARHYQPLPLILKNLDIMTMNKFNVLHWHVTDDQSFPFVSKTYPEISQHGAYSQHEVYTHDDIQTVIDAAYLRGIRVIPEFDLPGHSLVIGRSHPELMSKCDVSSGFSSPLNPTIPEVYEFVEKLYQEITALFPDAFIHIGGDEVRLDCWQHDPKIQNWARQHNDMTTQQLLNYFESILTDIVASCHKTPIAWQELLNEGVDLPPGTVIDVWKGYDNKTIAAATKKGYPVIISGCWYLDHLGDNWKKYYDCEPLNFNGTPSQKQLVMGGHASMWGERVDATDFLERVWPRASAVAERLWSGSTPKAYHDMNEKTVVERITRFRCFMVLRGVPATPIGPGHCEHEQPPPPLTMSAQTQQQQQRPFQEDHRELMTERNGVAKTNLRS